MIEGFINEDGVPVVILNVAGKDWNAVIDTGFNGDLELPFALSSAVNARLFGMGLSQLAGGQSVKLDRIQEL